MKKESILQEILLEISPSTEDLKLIEKRTKEIIKILKRFGLKAQIGGSFAKKTMLKKLNQDVDLFIVLEKDRIDKFEQLLKKTKLKFEIVHGSRDYARIREENLVFELTPVLKFTKPELAENVTDFSLIHVKYIKDIISKKPKLADEIRLAKAFCHAQDCYGAESYIGGFSGYALEVLVCHYGGFINFLNKIQKENVIDPAKQFKNKNEILRELNQSKLISPIILINPTYKYRNVCAGLTKETFELFSESAKSFLDSQSKDFFKKKEFILNDFKEKYKDLDIYELDIKTNSQEGDVAGTKMKKFFRFIIKELERKEQKIIDNKFIYSDGQEATGYLAIEKKETIEIIGPKKDMEKAIKEFKKVRKEIYTSKGFICAKENVSIENIFTNNTLTSESMGVGFDFRKI